MSKLKTEEIQELTAKQRIGKAIATIYAIAKVSVIVIVVITSLLGIYVILHAPLRNIVIDYIQGQHSVMAASPKG